MLRLGQALLAQCAPAPSKTLSATLNPETPAIKDVTEGVAARAVKPVAAKRSQEGVISVEEFWAIISCGARCAGEAKARFATLFPMTRPPPRRSMPAILGMAPFNVLT
jgi:hypothetical protein